MALSTCNSNCDMITHYLCTYHGHCFTLCRIHLSRHDTRSRFILRQRKFTKTTLYFRFKLKTMNHTHLGPLPRNRMSFAILFNDTAITFNCPLHSTIASCAAKDSNLLSDVTNGRPVFFAIAFAIETSHPFLVFSP